MAPRQPEGPGQTRNPEVLLDDGPADAIATAADAANAAGVPIPAIPTPPAMPATPASLSEASSEFSNLASSVGARPEIPAAPSLDIPLPGVTPPAIPTSLPTQLPAIPPIAPPAVPDISGADVGNALNNLGANAATGAINQYVSNPLVAKAATAAVGKASEAISDAINKPPAAPSVPVAAPPVPPPATPPAATPPAAQTKAPAPAADSNPGQGSKPQTDPNKNTDKQKNEPGRTRRQNKQDVVFGCPPLKKLEHFVVRGLDAREAMNKIPEYVLTIDGPREFEFDDESLSRMLSVSSYFAFGVEGGGDDDGGGDETLHHWGKVRHMEMASVSDDQPNVSYKLTLVPRFWESGRIFRSAVYQNLTVVGIVEMLLGELGFTKDEDYELRVAQKHPEREYTVQYEETDLAFITRLLEHEGMYFFFEHDAERDKLIIADNNAAFRIREGAEYVTYDARGSTSGRGETLRSLSRKMNVAPLTVELRDYNEATPDTKLIAEAPVDKKYGAGKEIRKDRFEDVADGKRLAKIRAQEHLVWRDTYEAISRVRAIKPGHQFFLEGHTVGRFDRQYLVVEAEHVLRQASEESAEFKSTAPGGAQASSKRASYENKLTLVPYDKELHFRAKCVTPKPMVHGLMTAKIDGTGGELEAPIDEHGRYKVQFYWDSRLKESGGKSSRWIRRAQSSGGPDYGIHLPVHLGTEVVIAHIDGDPDRPVIVGAVPNPATASPVSLKNNTQALIKTKTGIEIRFEDSQ